MVDADEDPWGARGPGSRRCWSSKNSSIDGEPHLGGLEGDVRLQELATMAVDDTRRYDLTAVAARSRLLTLFYRSTSTSPGNRPASRCHGGDGIRGSAPATYRRARSCTIGFG